MLRAPVQSGLEAAKIIAALCTSELQAPIQDQKQEEDRQRRLTNYFRLFMLVCDAATRTNMVRSVDPKWWGLLKTWMEDRSHTPGPGGLEQFMGHVVQQQFFRGDGGASPTDGRQPSDSAAPSGGAAQPAPTPSSLSQPTTLTQHTSLTQPATFSQPTTLTQPTQGAQAPRLTQRTQDALPPPSTQPLLAPQPAIVIQPAPPLQITPYEQTQARQGGWSSRPYQYRSYPKRGEDRARRSSPSHGRRRR